MLPAPWRCFKARRRAMSLGTEVASERRLSLRLKPADLIPTAGISSIPEPAVKIASEWRCPVRWVIRADFWEGDATSHCDEALFSEKKGLNRGFGKDFYREGHSVKRFGRFSEPPESEN